MIHKNLSKNITTLLFLLLPLFSYAGAVEHGMDAAFATIVILANIPALAAFLFLLKSLDNLLRALWFVGIVWLLYMFFLTKECLTEPFSCPDQFTDFYKVIFWAPITTMFLVTLAMYLLELRDKKL